eukprot:4398148-Prymnesium_polylepis.1
MPPRVRAAVGGAALAREARLCVCVLLARRSARSARWAGLSEGRAVRNSALVAGQTRQHDAGWWGGAVWTVGDRHPRLWLVRVGDV